jgi:hypothetical protein
MVDLIRKFEKIMGYPRYLSAKVLGVSASTFSSWAKGQYKMPKMTQDAICTILFIIEETDNNEMKMKDKEGKMIDARNFLAMYGYGNFVRYWLDHLG